MKPKTICQLIFLFSILICVIMFFVPQNYNDPDTYYYLSIEKHIDLSDKTILGNILYDFGFWIGKIFLLLCYILTAFLLIDLIGKKKYESYIAGSVLLLTPFNFFANGYFGRMDKNIFETLLFVIFCLITFGLMDNDYKKQIIVYGKQVNLHIKAIYFYIFYMVIFIIVSGFFWQGKMIFVIYATLYIIMYFIIIRRDPKKLFWCIIPVLYCAYLYMRTLNPAFNFNFINETHLATYHLMIPEFIMLVFILFFYYKHLPKEYFLMCIIVFISIFIFPRLMTFVPVLFCMGIALVWKHLMKYMKIIIFLPLIIFWVPSMQFFMHDEYAMIKQFPDPCAHNCTIVADWSYGHIYRYAWNETILYRAYPSNILDELDYLYYKNKSCSGCVYIYHPDDYERLDSYAQILKLSRVNLTNSSEMRVEYDEERHNLGCPPSMISNFLLEIILLVEAVIIHEIGHYIALTHYKIKYKFKVVWWGFLFEFDMYDCTPSQIFWCSFWGILFGLIPLIYASERVILIYLFMCCIDITNILGMMGIFKFKDKKLGVILYEQLVKYSPPKE